LVRRRWILPFDVWDHDYSLDSAVIVASTLPRRRPIEVLETRTVLATVTPHLATRAEIAEFRSKLADVPSKTHILTVLAALLWTYTPGLAGLAVLQSAQSPQSGEALDPNAV
jgi:hypothetical protein